MRVLLIKLSSMGDIVHTLPALSDAASAIPNIKFTWLVDQSFAEIPAWHPAVEQVIAVQLRRRNWRQVFKTLQQLRTQQFDLIIDAQGLLKSALFAQFVGRGRIAGFNYKASREWLASFFYDRKYYVAKHLHAIDRLRQLFANAFAYTLSQDPAQYRLKIPQTLQQEPYLFFLHGTTWESKHWPVQYWLRLIDIAAAHGYKIKITWANAEQRQRAQQFADHSKAVIMLPHLTLNEAAIELNNSAGVVAVDTGFAHLAAALNKPLVAVFGSTDMQRSGVKGSNSQNLQSKFACAPCMQRVCAYKAATQVQPACMQELSPELVWDQLRRLLVLRNPLATAEQQFCKL